MTFVSYSQNLEDVMLWRALRHVPCGFYMDVGAWDPRDDSVTLAFHERGWHGINVEPDADKHRLLTASRTSDINLCVALGRAPGVRTLYGVPGTGLSTLNPVIADRHRAAGYEVMEWPVAVRTLRDVCAEHAPPDIHFLKIDVEGLEADVLAGADFQRVRPWVAVVEATAPNSATPTHGEWEPGLLASGYALAYCDGLNRYYVADERARELLPAFGSPPNVFDDYVSAAGIRKAIQTQQTGTPVHGLQDVPGLHEALERAAAAQNVAEAARNATETATLRMLRAEREALLLRADLERSAGGTRPPAPALPATDPPATGRRRLYYDASLIVHHGTETAVGVIRTEHYVAEFLVRDPALEVCFVRFDAQLGGFRALCRDEAALLKRILLHRYDRSCPAPDLHWEPEPASSLALAHEPELDAPGLAADHAPRLRLLARRTRTALRLDPHEFDHMLVHYAVRLLPVTPRQKPLMRLAARVARRAVLHAARGTHAVAHGAATAVHGVLAGTLDMGRHILRPDTHPAAAPAQPPELPASPDPTGPPSEAPPSEAPPSEAPSCNFPPATVRFEQGAVLISLSNSWDYLDYAYLHRLVKHGGLRFVSVVFDVIAMQLPFTTPGPPHIYHRHWVEIGHSAAHLLAISQFTADQYDEHIARPNGLAPRISHAHLPSFLLHRADEIGEAPIPALMGRRFALFCSTIETRKNHQLLLHLWDRLRAEFGPDELPVLVFAGKWGWGTEAVRLMVGRNHRLRPHLMVLDRLGDAELIWAYRHSRFGLFPALSEGYGLAAAESLSFGTPVVISDCPALVEATEGLMPAYDPLDIVSWMAEMRRLIRGDERLQELRDAASRYRGPGYTDFAEAMRRIALSVSVAPAP